MEKPMRLTESEVQLIRSRYSDLVNYQKFDEPIDPLTYRDSGGDSLLHYAVARDDEETARALLGAGIDVNGLGDMDETPLHVAARNKNINMFKFLLANGARSELKNAFDKRPDIED